MFLFLFLFSLSFVSAMDIEFDSYKEVVNTFSTSSTTPVNVTDLKIDIETTRNQSHAIFWTITSSGNQSTTGHFEIWVDGVNVSHAERGISLNKGNIVLQYFTSKSLINHTIQPKVYVEGGGELTIENSSVIIFSLNDKIADLQHIYISNDTQQDTSVDTFEVLEGIDYNLTLTQPSRIVTTLDLSLQSDSINQNAYFVIEVNGTDSPESEKEFVEANTWGTFLKRYITDTVYPVGTYRIRAKWRTSTPNTIYAKEIHQSSFAIVDDLGNEVIFNGTNITSDTTTNTNLEDLDGSSISLELKHEGYILASLITETDVNTNNKAIWFTININGTDTEIIERGHAVQTKKGYIRQVTRSNQKFPSGNYTVKVRWKTETAVIATVTEFSLIAFATSTDACFENWIANYSACNILDNRTKTYYDENICGTTFDLPVDNGTIVYCDYCVQTWDCFEFDSSCGGLVSEIGCLNVSYLNPSCCASTSLPSDCDYLSIGNYSDFDKICGTLDLTLFVPTYPYVDFNVTYPMELLFAQNNVSVNLTNFYLNLTEPDGNTSFFNFTWDGASETYKLNLLFTEEGNFPFRIYADYPYDDIPEIAGTLIVREPYYITFEGFETKNQQTKPYDNDFAYFTAELSTSKAHYDPILEQFIVPLLFAQLYDIPVLNAPYDDGVAVLKLWETGEYAIRMVDGEILFSGVPNITKSYGLNTFIGEYNFDGTNQSYRILLEEKDLNQYRWLFNWIFIILLVLIIATSIFLFFVIPQHPQISIIFGAGFMFMLVLFRIVFFVWKGW